jgi:hydroxymethylbilane synthase
VKTLRLGTRGSQLALWQARAVAGALETAGQTVEIIVIRTTGDHLQEAPLAEVGGKRLFVKELEDALLRGEIDAAVHSAKDLPAVLHDDLAIAAARPREDARDAIVLPHGATAADLPHAAALLGDSPTIGTSSIRRIAQLSTLLPRAQFVALRGNVDTRLAKLDAGGFDAIVLAAAGLARLGYGQRISVAIPVADCVPAPGQGILAIEIRASDAAMRALMAALDDAQASAALAAERAVVAALGGGCQLPLGAVAMHDGADLDLHAIVASVDGRRSVRRHGRGPASDPAGLGRRVADELTAAGALAILDEVRQAHGPVTGSY